jgi:hypothetical protein
MLEQPVTSNRQTTVRIWKIVFTVSVLFEIADVFINGSNRSNLNYFCGFANIRPAKKMPLNLEGTGASILTKGGG